MALGGTCARNTSATLLWGTCASPGTTTILSQTPVPAPRGTCAGSTRAPVFRRPPPSPHHHLPKITSPISTQAPYCLIASILLELEVQFRHFNSIPRCHAMHSNSNLIGPPAQLEGHILASEQSPASPRNYHFYFYN